MRLHGQVHRRSKYPTPTACTVHLVVQRLRQQLPPEAFANLHDVACTAEVRRAARRLLDPSFAVWHNPGRPGVAPTPRAEVAALVSQFEERTGGSVPAELRSFWEVCSSFGSECDFELDPPQRALVTKPTLILVEDGEEHAGLKYDDFGVSTETLIPIGGQSLGCDGSMLMSIDGGGASRHFGRVVCTDMEHFVVTVTDWTLLTVLHMLECFLTQRGFGVSERQSKLCDDIEWYEFWGDFHQRYA